MASKPHSSSSLPNEDELSGIPWVQEIKPQKGVVPTIEELEEQERAKHQHLSEWLKGGKR